MKAIVKAKSFVFGALMAISLPAMAQTEPPPGGEMPPPPPPQTPPASTGGMGSQGQIVLSSDLPLLANSPLLGVIRTSFSAGGTSTSSTAVGIAASGDYFVAPNISVGGLLGYMDAGNTTTVAVFARGGYSLMLTDMISIWPRLGLGFAHDSVDVGGMTASSNAFWLNIEAPILFHPASHFFIGAGPLFSTQLSGSDPKRTDLGIETMIGGYFGG